MALDWRAGFDLVYREPLDRRVEACVPEVTPLLGLARFFRENLDPPLSRDEADRVITGVLDLDDLVGVYADAVDEVCSLYREAERLSLKFTRIRAEVEEHLVRAATAIQSRMPSSDADFNFDNRCFRLSAHKNATFFGVVGSPFQAMTTFVHVAEDGVIRARYRNSLGRDVVDDYDRYTGGWFGQRNHTYLRAVSRVRVQGKTYEFLLCAKRKGLVYGLLKSAKADSMALMRHWVPLEFSELPESPTIADLVIGRLVHVARDFAAASCAGTVKDDVLLDSVFDANTPRGEGEQAVLAVLAEALVANESAAAEWGDGAEAELRRAEEEAERETREVAEMYWDASNWMRGEIGVLAATGAASLCDGRNTLRTLARRAANRAGMNDGSAERKDFETRRREAEDAHRDHARIIRDEFLGL